MLLVCEDPATPGRAQPCWLAVLTGGFVRGGQRHGLWGTVLGPSGIRCLVVGWWGSSPSLLQEHPRSCRLQAGLAEPSSPGDVPSSVRRRQQIPREEAVCSPVSGQGPVPFWSWGTGSEGSWWPPQRHG